jgi:uncharacterized protein YlxW (UPF0749 family)
MFKCGFCGREYPTVEERMQCEANCGAKKKEMERKAKVEAEKHKKEEAFKMKTLEAKSIQEKYNKLLQDIKNYCKKYNEYPNLHTSDNIKRDVREDVTPNDMIDSLNRIMFDSFIKGFDGFGY